MAAPQSRGLFRMIFGNFFNSFRSKRPKGNLIGEDFFGNKYYEIPADPGRGKRNPIRWFDPHVKDDFQAERSSEWDAWLRLRRTEPPSEEEIMRNYQIAEIKKSNAKSLEEKAAAVREPRLLSEQAMEEEAKKYPVYPEYEDIPGSKPRMR